MYVYMCVWVHVKGEYTCGYSYKTYVVMHKLSHSTVQEKMAHTCMHPTMQTSAPCKLKKTRLCIPLYKLEVLIEHTCMPHACGLDSAIYMGLQNQ